MGDAGDLDAARADQFADVMRGGFALYGGIGGEDDLAHRCRVQALGEFIEADLFRADAVQGGEVAHQHEIKTLVAGGAFYGQHVGGGFYHAQQ